MVYVVAFGWALFTIWQPRRRLAAKRNQVQSADELREMDELYDTTNDC